MTDGPFKSLPMSRPCRRVMERVLNPAYSTAEVGDSVWAAAKSEFSPALLRQVSTAIQSESNETLFVDEVSLTRRLEVIRCLNPGSSPTAALVDNVLACMAEGVAFDGLFLAGLSSAVQHRIDCWTRQMEGHLIKKQMASGVGQFRNRMGDCRISDAERLAKEILSPAKGRSRAPAKKKDLDQGVSI